MSSVQKDEQRRLLAVGYQRAELTLEQLWLRFFALGGDAGLMEVEAHLHGLMPLPAPQRDILARTVNERLDELGWSRRVPYSRTIREDKPAVGPLAALVTLLEGTHREPPDRLATIVAYAGQALGVQVRVYLVDYDQRKLVPLASTGSPGGEPLRVNTTLAGRQRPPPTNPHPGRRAHLGPAPTLNRRHGQLRPGRHARAKLRSRW